MVERDHHHVTALGEARAFVGFAGTIQRDEAAAVEPNHDRAFAAAAQTRSPDVQAQAVFALSGGHAPGTKHLGLPAALDLRRLIAELERLAHARPRSFTLRRANTLVACRRTVRDAFEDVDAVLPVAANLPR